MVRSLKKKLLKANIRGTINVTSGKYPLNNNVIYTLKGDGAAASLCPEAEGNTTTGNTKEEGKQIE